MTAQLIDTQTGAHIWADRFDRKMADKSSSRTRSSVRSSPRPGGYGVIEMTQGKSAAKEPDEKRAYDYLRPRDDVGVQSRKTFRSARDMLLQAIALDPVNARARRNSAYLAVIGWVFRFDETRAATGDHRAGDQSGSTGPFRRTRAHGGSNRVLFQQNSSICSSEKPSRRWRLPHMTARSWRFSGT